MVTATTKTQSNNLCFGFSFKRSGVHTSRTMMQREISTLLVHIAEPNARKQEYIKAIEEDNCLGKRSRKTRTLTSRYLVTLYALDPSVTIFRSLLYFWKRDVDGQPLIALLCAYSRDSLLRLSAPFILSFNEGQKVTREDLEKFIDQKEPGRFSKATLKSTAININSTWTKAGLLVGRTKKVRSKPQATPGSVSYALFLGYLSGVRGKALFETEYARLLDCSNEHAIKLAEEASRRGWIVFKRVEKVIEALFPNILTAEEMEWIREQD